MATTGVEEVEYESDPEEVKRSLAMRRREAASDDEEGEREEENNAEARMDRRALIRSDESDGQGGAADYDDDEEELDLEEVEEEVYDEYEEEEEEIDEEEIDEVGKVEVRGNVKITGEDVKEAVVDNGNGDVDEGLGIDNNHIGEEHEEEKKENEPFAVPTAGVFYMHDDRFRDNVGGRHRRTRGGRNLWESKDDRKWGHDKFEEMTLQEKHYEEGRSSRGRYRAQSKNRGPGRGYRRGSGSKAFGKNNHQNMAPKVVRGRGPRRYEPNMKISGQAPPKQGRLSGKPCEKTSQANSGRASTLATNAHTVSDPNLKHIFASSLSSASPPFYPSGSSNKDTALTQKKDVHAESVSRNLCPSVTDENFSASQSSSLRGKNVLDSLSMAKLYIDDPSMSASAKPLTNVQMVPSGSSLGNTSQPTQSRVQGRGVAIPGLKAYQPAPHQNQANRVSSPTQIIPVQRNPVLGRAQYSVQGAAQQLGQHTGMPQALSPPKTAMSVNSYESGEVESSETSKPLVSKGKSSIQGAGRGSFLYSGAQVMGPTGTMAVGHGDKNFPAFLPVMQFGGQHPGGLSVPAVGMAFPGYVAQPQLGLGNSEMTWLPVLTSAAGPLGATFCSPYITVDGAYHARTSGQTSSTGSSSKEENSNKPNNEWKPSQRPEAVSDEFGQQQNNPNKQPRRYSEMSFSK
ncbi:protein MLN51 homolog [Gossypium raimondii]|uniref:Btz domain-containing protein n=1 Tax=Gossypium raimondii TaxID=29730 RepID=A0A0D2NIQ6_GOSRA|nr:protein MLN51 homolog [Gossypium raimondii]XP_012456752.1 protein MLN51 homolog [Gossypium raimondii]XP_052482008.1 protein MLN51 homolog [Gossypium raimondii]KJB13122.1 hypothetical protein B456_002G058500 [Gossypium raimondii]KJB13123.1 hypothetical protein B456_002G058500 [Gossypium raimondii]KJB13124.1 hypothetical protein B456_002G058500 [Gossypium raimondii]KJB13125.1 hypothetical protein B456_002G058500 [Gossypium raimondii]KJB13126.1 hypothetical protein B456_002G058500 [Gossypium